MKVSYLKKVLRAGVGTTFSKETQLESHNKPSCSEVQFQQPIQNRFPLSPMLWDSENEPEGGNEGIVLDELIGETSPIVKPGTMGDQETEAKQKTASDHHLSKPTINAKGKITEPNMSRSDVKRREKEAKKEKSRLQDIKDMIDIQQPEVKRAQSKESNGIPTVEVVKQDAIRVPRSNQSSSPSSVSQLAGINLSSQELNENKQVQQLKESTSQKRKLPEQLQPQPRKTSVSEPQKEPIRIPSDIAEQEKKVNEATTLVKTIEVIQKPKGQQNLNTRFFTESLKKGESQMAKITKDVALINKKLDQHINKDQSEPVKPVFLPKRPPSHNLGGWSNLERSYIR